MGEIIIKSNSKTHNTKPVVYEENENGCWICTSHAKSFGYPYITLNYKRRRLSRVIYEMYKGEIPKGYVVMHVCDNPNCINPNHLVLGTSQDNTQDMIDKGRNKKGTEKSNSKLTEKDVLFIKTINIGCTTLARKFNVSQTLIKMIRNNKCWKHVVIESEVK